MPVVEFGISGIVRCRRCRTYVNPYVTFTDAGRKWRCNMCALLNDGKFHFTACYSFAVCQCVNNFIITEA